MQDTNWAIMATHYLPSQETTCKIQTGSSWLLATYPASRQHVRYKVGHLCYSQPTQQGDYMQDTN